MSDFQQSVALHVKLVNYNLVNYNSHHFNRKIVFLSLEEILLSHGHVIRRSETRERGQGTAIAVRVSDNSMAQLDITAPVTIQIVYHRDKHFNSKIVFNGLEQFLRQHGRVIEASETRADGRGTPIAVRVMT